MADCVGVRLEADDACVRFDTACAGVRFVADCAGVRFDTDGPGVRFDTACAVPSPDAIAGGARGRRGVGRTASGDGTLRDAIATDARRLRESGGRTPANAADPSSSYSIALGAQGHGAIAAVEQGR